MICKLCNLQLKPVQHENIIQTKLHNQQQETEKLKKWKHSKEVKYELGTAHSAYLCIKSTGRDVWVTTVYIHGCWLPRTVQWANDISNLAAPSLGSPARSETIHLKSAEWDTIFTTVLNHLPVMGWVAPISADRQTPWSITPYNMRSNSISVLLLFSNYYQWEGDRQR